MSRYVAVQNATSYRQSLRGLHAPVEPAQYTVADMRDAVIVRGLVTGALVPITTPENADATAAVDMAAAMNAAIEVVMPPAPPVHSKQHGPGAHVPKADNAPDDAVLTPTGWQSAPGIGTGGTAEHPDAAAHTEMGLATTSMLDDLELQPGPEGPAGPPGPAGVKRWHGEGPPTVVIGAAPGDEYLDILTGDLYYLG